MPQSYHKSKGKYISMKFMLVTPRERMAIAQTVDDLYTALGMIGLGIYDVEQLFAVAATVEKPNAGLAVVLTKDSIFQNPDVLDLWTIVTEPLTPPSPLFAGPGVVFALNYLGPIFDPNVNETLDVDYGFIDIPETGVPIEFYNSLDEIETQITANRVARPTLSDGISVTWQWPAPAPPHMLTP
jgi:hypothetical protein